MGVNAKEFKAIKAAAEKQGWRVEQGRNNHWKWYPPTSSTEFVTSGGTESDYRALRNHVSRLRRFGFKG